MKKLILDIETTPNLADVWGLWQQNVGLNQLRESTRMFAFAAKWHGEKRVHFLSEYHDGPAEMVKGAYDLINEADVVIHFNGARFDMPHLRREFVTHGFGPHKPVIEVDLLKVVKSKFKLPSNKLQYVAANFLGLEGKLSHSGHDLWVRCMAGDAKAWAEMKRYNVQDIKVTEQVYDALRPWMHNHPAPELFEQDGVMRCAGCDGTEFQKRGTKPTAQSMYQWYSCKDCGKHRRGTKALYRISNVGVA